ncbi:LysM peptidoglycan-binding domain-containing protein [Weissella halotolerans]|uniref:Peptidoglycan-binding lysm n=1 Tax=Weissella halotolerans DSM 20190 TaxID=1123500 RepID=A0A0R2FY17_9LACO|nr:LysM domain-containing protein [Weissella halotolerans]KRN33329.1 peptidoglycan-binding lysm [Weissella halotolerans DSM 20190]
MSKPKEVALTVAGLATALAAGQTVVNAATTYTVKQGDTLSEVASKFNLSVEDLVSTNKITDENMIFTDQKLEVPDQGQTSVSASDAASVDAADEAAAKAVAEANAAKKQTAQEQAASQAEATTTQTASADSQAPAATQTVATAQPAPAQASASASGSVHDQFIAAGGTEAMWASIVMPESGGNPNAVNPAGYRGLGQTKEGWGSGSVAQQTQGMLNYATSRYGSVENALSFRAAHNWW